MFHCASLQQFEAPTTGIRNVLHKCCEKGQLAVPRNLRVQLLHYRRTRERCFAKAAIGYRWIFTGKRLKYTEASAIL